MARSLRPLPSRTIRLLARKVDLLDAQLKGLKQAQTGAVNQRGAELLDAFHLREDGRDLAAAENDGEALQAFGVDHVCQAGELAIQNLLVEKQDCGQRLVLG